MRGEKGDRTDARDADGNWTGLSILRRLHDKKKPPTSIRLHSYLEPAKPPRYVLRTVRSPTPAIAMRRPLSRLSRLWLVCQADRTTCQWIHRFGPLRTKLGILTMTLRVLRVVELSPKRHVHHLDQGISPPKNGTTTRSLGILH